jgi:hypothetical protein
MENDIFGDAWRELWLEIRPLIQEIIEEKENARHRIRE